FDDKQGGSVGLLENVDIGGAHSIQTDDIRLICKPIAYLGDFTESDGRRPHHFDGDLFEFRNIVGARIEQNIEFQLAYSCGSLGNALAAHGQLSYGNVGSVELNDIGRGKAGRHNSQSGGRNRSDLGDGAAYFRSWLKVDPKHPRAGNGV